MSGIDQHIVTTYLGAAENRDFLRNWFRNNVTADVLQEWMEKEEEEEEGNEISADTESEIGLKLKNSLQRSSMRTNMFQDFLDNKNKGKHSQGRRLSQLMGLSEMDVLMELIRDIANELDVDTLCHKILLNVSMLTQSDRGSLFLVCGSGDKKHLVSKLFDVTETSTLEDNLHNESNQIRVPFGKGIAGAVALTKETINIVDAYKDDRFNPEVDVLTGYHTKSILCMPIINYDGEVVGVAQIMNKKDDEFPEFTTKDEEVFRNYLTFCGIGLTNAQLFEMSVEEYKRNEQLLNLARGLFTEQQNLDKLVEKIMLQAQELLHFQRCNIYLREEDKDKKQFSKAVVDESAFNKIFQLKIGKDGTKGNVKNLTINDVEGSKMMRKAQEIALSREVYNIPDTGMLSDQELSKDYDGFMVKTILSIPIINEENSCIGVVQLMNKMGGKVFSGIDVNILQAFAIFFGLGIHNCQLFESTSIMMYKQRVAFEVLSYHATASIEEAEELTALERPDPVKFRLFEYDFSDFVMSDLETCTATAQMFYCSGIVKKFKVPELVLNRWILSVKRNYRPVTYHNWRHAFNVAQTMYTMIYTSKMQRLLSMMEIFSLLVACLCHDLDHRGTNNTFQNTAQSPIAQLYSTSTMEHHHFDQCVMILNGEGNNIFTNLTSSQYQEALKIVEQTIISTDLALYFQKKGRFLEMVATNETDWLEPDNKNILRSMMMTACDVGAITKPWEIQQEVAVLVSGEFFEQGDLERDMFDKDPIAMMDRKKKELLPKMQMGFIDFICMPLYKALADFEPLLDPLLKGVQNNRNEWQKLADTHDAEVAEEKAAEKAAEKEAEKAAEKAVEKVEKSTEEQKSAAASDDKAEVKKDTKAAVATGNKVIKKSDEANAAKTAGPSAEEGTGKTAEAAAAAAPKPHPVLAMKQKLQQQATKICNIL